MTRRMLVLLLGLGPALLPAALCAADADIAKQVIEASRKFQRAGSDKAHVKELKDLLDENVTHFHPAGPYRLVGRDRLLREFEETLSRTDDYIFEMLEPQVQVLSDTAAVLTYCISESFTERGLRKSVTEKATEVWTRKGGSWVMMHGHYSANP